MRILVDIVHPADVLFFCNPIRHWQSQGNEVLVASREKDVTTALLAALGIDHQPLTRAGRGVVGLALELLRRDAALLRLARRFRPDAMCGFGGVAIAHVGRMLGIPALSFYDTQSATLQLRLTLPFITHLYVPEAYDGPEADGRTSRFPGIKELSYLHPDQFTLSRERALRAGLDPAGSNWFLRLVNWRANHDIGLGGWDEGTLTDFVRFLAARGKVHISSERTLPAELECFRYRGAPLDIHHLLGYSDAYFGESATMASEAVLLGVPCVYAARDRRCYTDELASRGLLTTLPEVTSRSLTDAFDRLRRADRQQQAGRLAAYLAETIDLAEYVAREVLRWGASGC